MTFKELFTADVCAWGKAPSNATRKTLGVLSVIFLALLISLPVLSQTSQGTIQGAIFDQTRGAIPGATVTVTDVARGVTRTLTTDSVGEYVATNLTPGTYTVRGEAKGFQNTERTGVLIQVGQNIRVDLTLEPGAQTQTVTVTGEVPEIDTTDSTLGGTLSNAQIVALPLNGRNFLHLLDLRPGIYFFVGGSAPAGASTSTNGTRFGTDLLTVEGVPSFANTGGALGLNAMYHVGDSQSLVPIDSIQEFNTEQNAKAEYGWRAGSVINMGIKSGTNAFHGSAYAFGRDASATDAGNYFSTPGQPVVTPATVKQFGATLGGRIIKDKLFFFVAYEGLRTTLTNPIVDTIPASASVGDPTVSLVDACNTIKAANLANPILNPPVSALSAQLSGLSHFQSNDPASCLVSPASSTFENLFPSSPTGLFQPSLVTLGPLDNGLFKGDYAISQHHHVSGFFYRSQAYQVGNSDPGQILPRWEGNIPSTVEMFTGSWTWTPNSNWVNDVRAGLDYLSAQDLTADRNMFTQPAWPAGYGFNNGVTQAASPLYGGLPQIIINSVTGFLGSGRTGSVRGPDGEASFIDNVSYLRGKHSFKFGFQFMDLIYDNNSYRYNSGRVKFDNVQDFLSGTVHKWQLQIGNADVNMRAHWFSGFFQDDYRLSTRVTLNLGLRWEYQGPPAERGNYESTFNPNLAWPVQQVGGKGMPAMYNPYYKAFSPRLGVAWDVRGNGRTVVRAAASLLRDPQLIGDYVGFSPFGANVPDLGINTSGTPLNDHTPETLAGKKGINWTGSTLEPNATQSVFPVGQPISVQIPNGTIVSGLTGTTCLSPNDNVLSGVTPPACTTQAVNPKFVQPYLVAWNFDVQRAITNNLTIDVAYVGTHAGNQDNFIDVNQPPIGAGYTAAVIGNCLSPASVAAFYSQAAGFCVADPAGEVGSGSICTACPYGTKYPFLTNISQMVNNAYSNYNALQMTVGERASHGLAFLASYTYSHSLDIGSSHGGAPQIDAYNPRLNYGTSDFDITHHFSFAPDYNIPGIKSPGQMLQGWTVSGILSLSSGQPWFPTDLTNDILGTNEINGLGLGIQTWNYSGPRSAFTAGPTPIPCYVNADNGQSPLGGCANYSTNPALTTPQATQAWSSCVSAATASYAGNTQLQGLALASLNNIGCYITTKGGILLPPAYGTVGNASRNIFRAPGYFNVDFSIAKDWKFKERFGAQFRVEFFNVFNHANFQTPSAGGGGFDPGSGTGGLFGCACATPDVAGGDPVLGGGGPRHVQFGLKLNW